MTFVPELFFFAVSIFVAMQRFYGVQTSFGEKIFLGKQIYGLISWRLTDTNESFFCVSELMFFMVCQSVEDHSVCGVELLADVSSYRDQAMFPPRQEDICPVENHIWKTKEKEPSCILDGASRPAGGLVEVAAAAPPPGRL